MYHHANTFGGTMSNNIGAKCKQLYEMSLKNLEGSNPDLADEVIVALFKTNMHHVEQIEQLQRELLERSTNEQQKRLTEYYQQVAILETRLEQMTNERNNLFDENAQLKWRLEGLEK